MIKSIALSLAQELRELYPNHDIMVTPTFVYDLAENRTLLTTLATSGESNSHSVFSVTKGTNPRDRQPLYPFFTHLWSISINVDIIKVSVYRDTPKLLTFDNIPGTEKTDLEKLVVGASRSMNVQNSEFVLAEPGCVEKVIAKIAEHYPVTSKDNDA